SPLATPEVELTVISSVPGDPRPMVTMALSALIGAAAYSSNASVPAIRLPAAVPKGPSGKACPPPQPSSPAAVSGAGVGLVAIPYRSPQSPHQNESMSTTLVHTGTLLS